MVDAKLKLKLMKKPGEIHVVAYYGTKPSFGTVTPKQILPYEEKFEEFSKEQKIGKKYQNSFSKAVEQAQEEIKLEPSERMMCLYRNRRRTGAVKKKRAAPESSDPPPAAKKKRPAKTTAAAAAAKKPAPKSKAKPATKKSSSAVPEEDKDGSEVSVGVKKVDVGVEPEEDEEDGEAEFDDVDEMAGDDEEYAPATKTEKKVYDV